MPDISQLIIFLSVTLAILLTPGPAVLYVMAVSMDNGRRAGLSSVLGLGIGNLFHAFGAVLGISALLAASATAFSSVKFIGAGYLLFLSIQKLFSKNITEDKRKIVIKSSLELFRQGIIVNVLNPKSALFFLSFLPQFVISSDVSASFQLLILGSTFVILGIITDGLYAFLSAFISDWFRGCKHYFKIQKYVSGTVYVGLGIYTALSGYKHK